MNDILQARELVSQNKIITHLSGSKCYGTSTPESDTDIRGLFLANPINIRTPFYKINECEIVEDEDTKYYELTHFMKLLIDNNPNIVETLWVDDEDIMFKEETGIYDYLRSFNADFLCSKVAFTYAGYAFAQLKRIKGHNKWINNPQSNTAPRQIDFVTLIQNFTSKKMFKINLEEYHVGYKLVHFDGNIFGVYLTSKTYSTFDSFYTLNTHYLKNESIEKVAPLFLIKFNREEYNIANEKWKNYWKWKNNRNEVRAKLEEANEYDTKHAMHLVRLLRTGLEILQTGKVHVKRTDAADLLAIRNGSMTYDELLEYAEHMDNEIKVWYKKTDLPKYPDIKLASNVLMTCQDMMWNK